MTRRLRLTRRLLAAIDAQTTDRILSHYFPEGASGPEFRYRPWLQREVSSGRLVLNDGTARYLRDVLGWFSWLVRQDSTAIQQDTGIPTDDDSWKNILAYRYSDRGGGLAALYRDFMRSHTPLTQQYLNFKRHH